MLEHKIIELLEHNKGNGLALGDISSRLNIAKYEICETLKFLEESGLIFLSRNKKYFLVSVSSLRKGIIKITRRKGPIVVLDDGSEYDLVYNSHSKVAHNDIVLVEPNSKENKAQLFKVIKRVYIDYVGEVQEQDGRYLLVFKDGRKPIPINKKYPLGTRILIDSQTDTIKEVIGHKDDPDIKVKELLLVNGFSTSFTEDYLKELEKIPSELDEERIAEEKSRGRLDFRKLPFVTIDGEDTKDFDDALCFWFNNLGVAIADIPSFIKEGSIIDKEAISRGISVYPPGAVEPMFHHAISNGICSLNPHEDRFTIASITTFDSDGSRISCKVMPTIINSKMRMTYEDVNLFLEHKVVVPGYEAYTEMLNQLYNVAMLEKQKILNEGFLEFSSSEVKMLFNDRRVSNIKKRHHGKAEELIEFLMLYHNLEMTSQFIRRSLPYIARNHDRPKDDKITAWNRLLSQRHYKVEIKHKYNNEDIKCSLKSYQNSPEKVVLDNIGIMSQSKAIYSAYNKGHFALGQKAYATFTSPIRRLSDYINQRIYMDALEYGDKYARDKWEPRMETLANMATQSEQRADKVEETATKIKMAEYMISNYAKGSKFKGFITYIGKDYLRVLLSDSMIYGIVYYNPKDWTISKDSFSLINNLNGERLLVGDQIDLMLKSVNLDSSEIIFSRQKSKECCYEEEKKGKTKVKTR